MDRLLDDNVMPSKAAIVASFLKTRACAGRKEYWESLTVVGPRAGALRALHVDLHRSPTLTGTCPGTPALSANAAGVEQP
jgi:hypothetical protein